MALDKQVNMYSVDTGHFYSNHEKYLHDMNCKYRSERNYLRNQLQKLAAKLIEYGYDQEQLMLIQKNEIENFMDAPEEQLNAMYDYIQCYTLIDHKRQKAKESKEKLLCLLKNKINQNIITNGADHIRVLREQDLHEVNIISVFESSLTRTIGVQQDELTDDLLVVQVYYFDLFKDMVFYGFQYKGEKYKYYTSSAGQIRKKKGVFIKESTWNRIEKTIMCGLTIETINKHGGNNVNKHLAYMALANSATDLWEGFDIDKSIVIDDFETNVAGIYDFIDDKNYSIVRTNGLVPIPHTDGAGMMLPTVFTKNTMVRLPWIKGLLGVFDFKQFIIEKECSPIIKDIYGAEHDVIKEDIQIIFTKSQFKMYKYYDSWEQYKEYFKKYCCSAGICNMEEDRIKDAKINYQMLQTLTDITDDEIDTLIQKSKNKIVNICTSEDTMKSFLGITPYNTQPTPFQEAVKIYPALLNDTYAKDVLREIKNSLLKKYRSGKLEIKGKYTFVLPDFYAACEYWFQHIDQPSGLLQDQEVFCWLFKHSDKLDCLRSPHLFKEHAIRFNLANNAYGMRSQEIRRWFITDGIYTSTHDLITKILQLDGDGDKLLVVYDHDFIKIAERNMNGIVPLYYDMKKAKPSILTNENIYQGLNAAFTHGNIGAYSNNISKIWNSEIFVSGSEVEKQEAINCVKLLCMENNFVIDAAKTLYLPTRPAWFTPIVSKFTNQKLPAFFEYAKDKKPEQVETRNGSFVNKIYTRIPDKGINTRGLKLGTIDYKKMMSNVNIVCSKEVSDLYDKLNKEYRYKINLKDEYIDNMHYIACQLRNEFTSIGYSDQMITDMLVQYTYGKKKRYKQLLWFCYGKQIVANLKSNIEIHKTKYIQCIDCGEWLEVDSKSKTCRCPQCQHEYKKVLDRQRKRRKK